MLIIRSLSHFTQYRPSPRRRRGRRRWWCGRLLLATVNLGVGTLLFQQSLDIRPQLLDIDLDAAKANSSCSLHLAQLLLQAPGGLRRFIQQAHGHIVQRREAGKRSAFLAPKFAELQQVRDVEGACIGAIHLTEIHVVVHHQNRGQDILEAMGVADLLTCRAHLLQLRQKALLGGDQIGRQGQGFEPLLKSSQLCEGGHGLLHVTQRRILLLGRQLQLRHVRLVRHHLGQAFQLVLIQGPWFQ
mmetsp:Transcript_45899/g.99993  ORF Transcript_45899/g.99993 Transcript_45899/m.99993 type:complete len:243 (-) Transcript_45899:715-1443(-)